MGVSLSVGRRVGDRLPRRTRNHDSGGKKRTPVTRHRRSPSAYPPAREVLTDLWLALRQVMGEVYCKRSAKGQIPSISPFFGPQGPFIPPPGGPEGKRASYE